MKQRQSSPGLITKVVNALTLNEDGRVSHTKLWSNVAYAIASFKFMEMTDPNADIWMAYLGIVGGAAVASKLITMKYGNGTKE